MIPEDESLEDLLLSIRRLVYPSVEISSLPEIQKEAFLSSQTVTQNQEALSSFVQTLKTPPLRSQTIENFFSESLEKAFGVMLKDQKPLILSLVKEQVEAHAKTLLKQWLDEHMVAIVKACVADHLDYIKKNIF